MPAEDKTVIDPRQILTISPNVWAEVVLFLYKKLTEDQRHPLSNDITVVKKQDLKHHIALCDEYKSLLHKSIYPKEWILENNTPTYECPRLEQIQRLKGYCNDIEQSHYSRKNQVIALLACIENLFREWAKDDKGFFAAAREKFNCNRYRSDGFEAMFFCDLAMWLAIDLPRYDMEDIETAILIEHRIQYCKRVNAAILFDRRDSPNTNPKNAMKHIIAGLEALHADVCELQTGISFNKRIKQINSLLESTMRQTFNLFYLISDKAQPSEIVISKLLKPNDGDVTIAPFCNSEMGRWLIAILNTLGITGNNFKKTKDITLAEIKSYIRWDPLKRLDSYGLHQFAIKNTDLANKYLKQILEIYYALLTVYCVTDSVTFSGKVELRLGHPWIYGSKNGSLVVDTLLQSVEYSAKELNIAVQNFWKHFYTDDYCKQFPNADAQSGIYNCLMHADELVNGMKDNLKKIEDLKKLIKIDQDKYNSCEEKKRFEKEYKNLINTLVEMTDVFPIFDAERKAAIKKLKAEAPILDDASLTCNVISMPLKNAPLYVAARDYFNKTKALQSNDYVLIAPPSPSAYYSDLHKDIYHLFLMEASKRFKWTQGLWWMVGSVSYNVRLFGKIDQYTEEYARVNAIMKLLYSRERPDNLELNAVNWILRNFLNRIANNCYRLNYIFCDDKSVLNVSESNAQLQVTLSEDYIDYVSGGLKQQLKEAKEEIVVLKTKLEESQQTIHEKDTMLAESQQREKESQEQLKESKERVIGLTQDNEKMTQQLSTKHQRSDGESEENTALRYQLKEKTENLTAMEISLHGALQALAKESLRHPTGVPTQLKGQQDIAYHPSPLQNTASAQQSNTHDFSSNAIKPAIQ